MDEKATYMLLLKTAINTYLRSFWYKILDNIYLFIYLFIYLLFLGGVWNLPPFVRFVIWEIKCPSTRFSITMFWSLYGQS